MNTFDFGVENLTSFDFEYFALVLDSSQDETKVAIILCLFDINRQLHILVIAIVLQGLQDFTAKSKRNHKQTADEMKIWFQFLPKCTGFMSMEPFNYDLGLLAVRIAYPMAITHFIWSDFEAKFFA